MAVKGGYATRVGKSSLLPLCIPEVATRIFAHPVLHILITYLMGYEYMQDEAMMYAKKVAHRHALSNLTNAIAQTAMVLHTQYVHTYKPGRFEDASYRTILYRTVFYSTVR